MSMIFFFGNRTRLLVTNKLLITLVALLIVQFAGAVDVLTSRNTLSRAGVNAEERILTPALVNPQSFGKLWTLYADGHTARLQYEWRQHIPA